MKETRIIMGMPVTVDVVSSRPDTAATIEKVFAYFTSIDQKFSTYKKDSEITMINEGQLDLQKASEDMRTIFALAEETRREANGYFDIRRPQGGYDPSGIVKGWAIWNASLILENAGFTDFYIDAGGDIQTKGRPDSGDAWRVGIRNPWDREKNVKIIAASGQGVATSGTYIRGDHIYDPKTGLPVTDIASLTVIAPNIYEADRFATAAFAMGKDAITFLEGRPGLAAYMIDNDQWASMTSDFEQYVVN